MAKRKVPKRARAPRVIPRWVARRSLTPAREATLRRWLLAAPSGPEFVRRFLLAVRRQVRNDLVGAGWSTRRIRAVLGPVQTFRTTGPGGRLRPVPPNTPPPGMLGRTLRMRLPPGVTGYDIFTDPIATMLPDVAQRVANVLPRWASANATAGNMTDRCLWFHTVMWQLNPGVQTGNSQRGHIRPEAANKTIGAESHQSLMRNLQVNRAASQDESGVSNLTRGFFAYMSKYGSSPARWVRLVGITPRAKSAWRDWRAEKDASRKKKRKKS